MRAEESMGDSAKERTAATAPGLAAMKAAGRRIVMTTAYDLVTARLGDAVADVLLVGDSVGTVCLGFPTTLPVTQAMIAHHLDAVMRAGPKALVVADMAFLSCHLDHADTIRNAGDLIRRGAGAVKIEGGGRRVETIRRVIDSEIPVMGHLGLTPQSFNAMGGHKVQARKGAQVTRILDDACALEAAGCFALVLEGVPAPVAARITKELTIPTIGIGAGVGCDGQVLVIHDILGLTQGHKPRFVRCYVDGFGVMSEAMGRWARDVREGAFPGDQESYALPEDGRAALEAWRRG
jgi:3-methyl-2-oxobutanoate hydroxymethyltransferase